MLDTGWGLLVIGGLANIIFGIANLVASLGDAIGFFPTAYIVSSGAMVIGIFLIIAGYLKRITEGKKPSIAPLQNEPEDSNE